jgi:hypothetical protein
MARKSNAVMMATVAEVLNVGAVDENAVLADLMSELEGTAAPIGAAADEIIEVQMEDGSTVEVIEPDNEPALAAADAPAELPHNPNNDLPDNEGAADIHKGMKDADFDAVELQAAIAEATQAAYASAGGSETASDADKPSDASDVNVAVGEKKGKGRAKAAPTERHVVLTKSQKVASKLGDKVSEFLVLEMADAELDEAALKAKQETVLAEIDTLAKKVSEKAVQLFGWMRNGGSLNEVMKRTFEVLAKEGELTSGEKGNLQQNLLAKPYSKGTAASQANQMFMLLPMLKVTRREKGRMIANPDSLILAKAKAELGL